MDASKWVSLGVGLVLLTVGCGLTQASEDMRTPDVPQWTANDAKLRLKDYLESITHQPRSYVPDVNLSDAKYQGDGWWRIEGEFLGRGTVAVTPTPIRKPEPPRQPTSYQWRFLIEPEPPSTPEPSPTPMPTSTPEPTQTPISVRSILLLTPYPFPRLKPSPTVEWPINLDVAKLQHSLDVAKYERQIEDYRTAVANYELSKNEKEIALTMYQRRLKDYEKEVADWELKISSAPESVNINTYTRGTWLVSERTKEVKRADDAAELLFGCITGVGDC